LPVSERLLATQDWQGPQLPGGPDNQSECSAPDLVTTADKRWLQGNSGATTCTADPTSRATFGVFKSADDFIYLREIY